MDVLKSVNPSIDMRGTEIITHRYINYQSGGKHQRPDKTQRISNGEYRRYENNRNRQSERHDQSDKRGGYNGRRQQTDRR